MGRSGQGAEDEAARALEAGQVGAAELLQRGLVQPAACPCLDEGPGRLAPFRMRRGDDGGQQPIGVAMQHALPLEARDILAPGDDDVLGAVADLDLAIGVHHGEVAGMEDAAAKGVFRRLGIAEIARHDGVSGQHDLAHGLAIGGHIAALFIHHARAPGGRVAAALAGHQRGAAVQIGVRIDRIIQRGGPVAFGQAIHVRQVEAELREARQQGRGSGPRPPWSRAPLHGRRFLWRGRAACRGRPARS